MLPTTGRSNVDPGGVRSLDVQGGGDLSVRAGNDVIGGSYLIGRGDGRVAAAGSVGATAPTQLFMMGVSSGNVPAHAEISVSAGGSIDLQSINNPTALFQRTGTPGLGPSFRGGPTGTVTYFSYSANGLLNLLAQAGDVKIGSQMAAARLLPDPNPPRTTPPYTPPEPLGDKTESGAFPASVMASALEGNVSLGLTRPIVTFPSASAQVVLLAGGSLDDPNLTVSDLSAGGLADVSRPVTLDPRNCFQALS